MKIERTKNTVRNIGSGLINHFIGILLPFFTRTVLLYIMGTKYLGLSSLFSSILSFLSLTELGIGSAMVYSMYKPIAENDSVTICALLNLYRKLYFIIGTVIMTLGLSLMPFLDLLIKDEIPPEVNLYVLYFIYLMNAVLSYWLFAYKNALLQAHQRNDVTSNIVSVITPISYIVMLGALFITRNYYAYVIWIPIFTIITNLIRSAYVDRHYPDLKPKGDLSKDQKQSITKKVSALIGTKLNTVILNASDNLVMSAFLGLTMIAVYGNYCYIRSSVSGIVGIAYSAMTAGLGNSLHTETTEKNYRDFTKLSFMNSWIVGWCTICLACLYQPFMRIWVGDKLMLPYYVVLEICLYFYIYMIRKIPVVYKDAAGIWWEDRFRPYVCMIVNVVLNITLVQFIGISGIILSSVFSLMISIPWENYTIFKHVFHRGSGAYYRKMFSYAGAMLIAGAVTYGLCSFFGEGILFLLLRGFVCVIVPNVIFVCLNFYRQEFRDSVNMIKRILMRRF